MDKMDSFKALPEVEYEIARILYQTGKSLDLLLSVDEICKNNIYKNYGMVHKRILTLLGNIGSNKYLVCII